MSWQRKQKVAIELLEHKNTCIVFVPKHFHLRPFSPKVMVDGKDEARLRLSLPTMVFTSSKGFSSTTYVGPATIGSRPIPSLPSTTGGIDSSSDQHSNDGIPRQKTKDSTHTRLDSHKTRPLTGWIHMTIEGDKRSSMGRVASIGSSCCVAPEVWE
ncbi:hypothetical protein RND71_016422 [Anisodus tanguticus]|uniref:Uncharacterized protein n=1 Tax=Anisodus tanguticus TaxID=243964 RepID=A0AAE1VLB3_9SOLA|nr:hypothetical protein RND71_016422 [Anisodus tanguticus]